mmetsp:Transcript_51745/g.160481  ORF Transcript_51745/g.160481 Transcript_51745/m.160481 type:complete len:220 (+) Transcript_51745:506-1165(+)
MKEKTKADTCSFVMPSIICIMGFVALPRRPPAGSACTNLLGSTARSAAMPANRWSWLRKKSCKAPSTAALLVAAFTAAERFLVAPAKSSEYARRPRVMFRPPSLMRSAMVLFLRRARNSMPKSIIWSMEKSPPESPEMSNGSCLAAERTLASICAGEPLVKSGAPGPRATWCCSAAPPWDCTKQLSSLTKAQDRTEAKPKTMHNGLPKTIAPASQGWVQ